MSNVWEIGSEISRKNESESPANSSVLFLGNKNSGKSSLIYKFLGRKEEPKETLALHYYHHKFKGNDLKKETCNVWELGESCLFIDLLDQAIRSNNISNLTIVLCIDLSRPEEILSTLDLMAAVRQKVDRVLSRSSSKVTADLASQMGDRLGGERTITGSEFPLPLIVVGTKYDIFRDFDSDDRKVINRFLRCFASSLAASLIYTSTRQDSLMTRFKSFLSSITSLSKVEKQDARVDHSKPLWIVFGRDLLEDLNGETVGSARNSVENRWKQLAVEQVVEEDPAKDKNFAERDIDLHRLQCDEELRQWKQRSSLVKR